MAPLEELQSKFNALMVLDDNLCYLKEVKPGVYGLDIDRLRTAILGSPAASNPKPVSESKPAASGTASVGSAAAPLAVAEPVPAAGSALTIGGKTTLERTEDSTKLTAPVEGDWSLPTPNGANFWGGKGPTDSTTATVNGIKAGITIVQFKSAAGAPLTITITKPS